MASKYSYLLRTAAADGTSYDGFRWPLKGAVEAPDWDPKASCGGGLHGLLWGEGDGSLLSWAADARWQVVKVLTAEVVAIDGGLKVKVPRGTVVHSGSQRSATDYLQSLARGSGKAIVGATTTAGDYGTAIASYYGTATAGNCGTATAGNCGTATAGYCGTATAGEGGIIQLTYYSGGRKRLIVGYIGEDGLLPDVAYQLTDDGKFKRVKEKVNDK